MNYNYKEFLIFEIYNASTTTITPRTLRNVNEVRKVGSEFV